MVISTNPKPTIYRNLYENTSPGGRVEQMQITNLTSTDSAELTF